jgi:acetyl esterase/lipase
MSCVRSVHQVTRGKFNVPSMQQPRRVRLQTGRRSHGRKSTVEKSEGKAYMSKILITMTALLMAAHSVSTRAQPSASAQPAVAPSRGESAKLTVDSTIGELLDNPAARAVLERHVPVIVSSPQIAQARTASLRSIQVYAPMLLTDERLRAIDEELARTPGAVASGKRPAARLLPADPRVSLQLKTVSLWEGRAPLATGERPEDVPTLTIVGTDGAVSYGTAVVVAPGGGYQALATGHEGRQIADWFAAHGVTAFVLSYRLASAGYRHPAQLEDAKRAIRWVRANAEKFGVSPQRIGMIGFSAGGHLTAMASTSFDAGDPAAADPVERMSSRPDFAVLIYAATVWSEKGWNPASIAGDNPNALVREQLSPANRVTERTPPTFLLHTSTDAVVPPENALAYYRALRAAKVPAEMHIFENGAHGLGFAMADPSLGMGPVLLQNWLRAHSLIGTELGATGGSK